MFVVYEVSTTRYAGKRGKYDDPIFETIAAAKSHMTRLVKSGKYAATDLAFAEIGTFRREIEAQVTVKNLMSGKDVVQSINTPRCCDVSSELYWSM